MKKLTTYSHLYVFLYILFATTSIGLSIGQVVDGNCADPIITYEENTEVRTCLGE